MAMVRPAAAIIAMLIQRVVKESGTAVENQLLTASNFGRSTLIFWRRPTA